MVANLKFNRLYNLGNFNNATYTIELEKGVDIQNIEDTDLVTAMFKIMSTLSDECLLEYTNMFKKEQGFSTLDEAKEFLDAQRQLANQKLISNKGA